MLIRTAPLPCRLFAAALTFAAAPSMLHAAADAQNAVEKPAADVIVADDKPDAASDDAKNAEPSAGQPTYGSPVTRRMRIGARVEAKGGEVQNIYIMVAAPLSCPEQRVEIIEEEYPTDVGTVDFRTLPDDKRSKPGANQMLISIPQLPARQTANAVVTYEIQTDHVYAPTETAGLRIPPKTPSDLKLFVKSSPFIEVNDREIRDAVAEALEKRVTLGDKLAADSNAIRSANLSIAPAASVAADAGDAKDAKKKTAKEKPKPKTKEELAELEAKIGELTDWQKVEALYDFVRTKVKYLDGAEDMPATKALEDGEADCYGLSALFVAMARTMKVPARMVWVDNHQYAEFYLEDEEGKGYWYPAQLAGTRAFGEMPLPMVIFQKGDNFRVPERRRERLRYATDYTTLKASGKHKPRVVYVREPLTN
ncbi:transglutaminase-like domain-containing protein [Lacipirellula sp.]|uniref:transglutaminase-like domain-containing protein n=1 Tax=Lacipirellula sp. TaxID=2691419 RepID=UPI003D0FE6E3